MNSIFDCRTPAEALAFLFERRNGKRKVPLSLVQVSKKMGYRSPRALGMVIKGQRKMSLGMVWALAKAFALPRNETRFLELLVSKERLASAPQDIKTIEAEMSALYVRYEPELSLNTRAFAFIANWYHLVLKQIVESPDFRNSEAWILQKMKGKINADQMVGAFRNMLALGLLEKVPGRGWRVKPGSNLRGTEDIPAEANRLHHAQMMQRAVESLNEHGVEEREILSWTLRVAPERMPEAKKMLREFGRAFNSRFSDDQATSVHQLNMQFFRHTRD